MQKNTAVRSKVSETRYLQTVDVGWIAVRGIPKTSQDTQLQSAELCHPSSTLRRRGQRRETTSADQQRVNGACWGPDSAPRGTADERPRVASAVEPGAPHGAGS